MSLPGLFLDRDGVVNFDENFVHRPEDFRFQPAIFALVKRARDLGYAPVVVTNQSGIARGLFTEAQYLALTEWMLARFAEEGAAIERVYHCPFYPDATVPEYRHPDHPWRKPNPGMLLAARDELDIDLALSVMIGDRWGDAYAGAAAGLRHIALIGTRADREGAPASAPMVERLATLGDAIGWLDRIRTA